MLSALQNAWDRLLKASNAILVLCGSHMHTMESLMFRQSPLFGRLTVNWPLQPLLLSSLGQFFPQWNIEDLIAAFALLGGIPVNLEWLDPERSLVDNIRAVNRRGMLPFEAEAVGSHWSVSTQVDVVAVNWHSRDILLGECKWGESGINQQIVRDLIEEKTPKVMADRSGKLESWRVHYVLFSRKAVTSAAAKKYSS